MKRLLSPGIILTLVIMLVLPVSCSNFSLVAGSGNIITRTFDLTNFSQVEVTNAFEIELTRADSYSVSITAYENLFDHMNISRSGDTLNIKMKPGTYTNTNLKATVSLPQLKRLTLSGAAHGSAKGFQSNQDFQLVESGASTLEVDIQAGNTTINNSGASKTTGLLRAQDIDVEVSGASSVDLEGSGNNLKLTASGASTANLPDFALQNANVNFSGASRGTINVTGSLDVELSGASALNYSGNPSLGRVNVTGASSLNQK
jgi:hypothetical protein